MPRPRNSTPWTSIKVGIILQFLQVYHYIDFVSNLYLQNNHKKIFLWMESVQPSKHYHARATCCCVVCPISWMLHDGLHMVNSHHCQWYAGSNSKDCQLKSIMSYKISLMWQKLVQLFHKIADYNYWTVLKLSITEKISKLYINKTSVWDIINIFNS